MKKRVIALLLAAAMFVMGGAPAVVHEKQDEHDKDLKYALFGSREKVLSGDEKVIFKAISNAAALTIDQYSLNETERKKEKVYKKLQEDLDNLGLPKISICFDDLDLNRTVAPDGKNIAPNTHRKYTHLGWNYKNYPNEEFWKLRKQVLLHTVNWTLFNDKAAFSWVPGLSDALYSPSEQCEAFSAMVYYIHILGDHIEGDVSQKLEYLEPIQYVDAFTPGIITELKEQLRIVFKSQNKSWSYAGLMDAITTLEVETEEEYKTWGKLDTNEKCEINKYYAEEILRVLSAYLPQLLANEPFFNNHFK